MQTTGGNRHLNPAVAIASRLFIGFARDGWCQLCRLLLVFAFLSLLFSSRAIASSSQDLRFQLRLVNETAAYHRGEPILLEISYSTSTKDKYQRSSNSALQGIAIHIVPFDGVLDLNVLRFEHGWAGSIIGGMGLLSSQPTTQQIDLCSLYRFEKPGHYSVAITSNEASRIKSAEEGGGVENLTLESNWAEFDVLPSDPAWAAAELNSIELELNSAEPGALDRAVGRLGRLDTPASARKLLQLYLLRGDAAAPEWLLVSALRESSQLEVIIPPLEAMLSDPSTSVPSTLPQLLADLHTRKDLGVLPPYPTDDAKKPEWNAKEKHRSEVREKYFEQANGLLVASIPRRSGPQRATAIYQAWYDAEVSYRTKPLSPDILSERRFNVLAVENELTHGQRLQFVVMAHQTMPHHLLLPIIRSLASDSGSAGASFENIEPYKLWCEDAPEECRSAILADVQRSQLRTDKNIVLLVEEGEHTDLDGLLKQHLNDPKVRQDWGQAQRLAAVVLRVASRNLAVPVIAWLTELTGKPGCGADVEASLWGYLFRIGYTTAGKQLSSELWDRKDDCGGQVIRSLHAVRYSDELLPIITKALNSPNSNTVTQAALFLGEHGSPPSQELLWQRLESLWAAWHDRASELQVSPMNFSTGANAAQQAAQLEQALASALAHAKNWKLSPAEIDRLRSGCLTDACREVADGHRILNL
jgi:hypothetical protein